MKTKAAPILIVEDSPEDFAIVSRALRQARVPNAVVRCQDGDEALDYLHHRGAYADAASWRRPALILLDLNLPGMDGAEVLMAAKAEPSLKTIPVVVLTTSHAAGDIDRCYALGAAGYIRKPIQLKQLEESIRSLTHYWFQTVQLPKGEPGAWK
jgi:CheY-like chemotaxis protein